MKEVASEFSAAPSAAGYLYQARLALALSIQMAYADSATEVTVEGLDDITFENGPAALDLLQTKHHIDRVGSLSDTSADLWRTLRVWAVAVAKDPSLPGRARLLLMTTGTASADSAAALLRPSVELQVGGGKRDPKQAQIRLTEVASNSENQALKPAFEAFLALVPEMRSSLLSAVQVLDQQPVLTDLEGLIEKELRLVAPKGKVGVAREMLEGWWWSRICTALMGNPVGSIAISNMEAKIDDIRESFKRDALVADFASASPPEEQIVEYEGFNFVRQLKIINIGGARIQFAKRDYYRAFAQRSKWTRDHAVLDDEIVKFESMLIEEWQPRFSAMTDSFQELEPEGASLERAGREVYEWMEQEARFPLRTLVERFLNVGSYHMLANSLRVGWHKDYLKICGE